MIEQNDTQDKDIKDIKDIKEILVQSDSIIELIQI